MDRLIYFVQRYKLILILCLVILSVILILIFNNQEPEEEVTNFFEPQVEENQEDLNMIKVNIKGAVKNPGVYEISSNSRVEEKTTTNMIQKISSMFAVNPLFSKGI